jgi:hypothetical protein
MPRLAAVLLLSLALALLAAAAGPRQSRGAAAPCRPLVLGEGYADAVDAALRARRDVWGNRLLARPEGPTYEGVAGLLQPLLLVGRPAGRSGTRLTESGVHYLALGEPGGRSFADGGPTEPFALHVADGSQVVSRQANGRSATIYVGAGGAERYGSCLSRLEEPRLAGGYLPVPTVRYTDADGVRYEQESFVARDPRSGALSSHLRLAATRGSSTRDETEVRVVVSDAGVTAQEGELRAGGKTVLAFDPEGALDADGEIRFRLDLASGRPAVLHLVRPIEPTAGHPAASADGFARARAGAVSAWRRRLAEGASYDVPEPLVMDAQRSLLVQNLQLAWRYSLGNVYETFYQPESSAAVLRLAEYGFLRDARTALEALLPRTRGRSTNWEQGEKLAAAAAYYMLSGDAAFLRRHEAAYAGYARDFAVRRARDPHGLLDPQRYSGDINQRVYGFHHQARAWRGLRDMAYVWGLTGRTDLASRYRAEAAAFAASLRAAIARSAVEVAPGETFVPAALLRRPPERPWNPVTATREGSYWNLVAPYGWASGILGRDGALARDVLRYALRRGSFLLGLVRFDYYPTGVGKVRCDGLPGLRTPGTVNGYGVHRAQFLAALDRPDLLVLTLYGTLAHGLTRGTFVAGEGETLGPVRPGACPGQPEGEYHRSLYLPPSSAGNDLFLVTLREQLVHWYARENGRPHGLHLAFSTPRAWLADGKRISVRAAPTPFGRLTYSLESRLAAGYVDVRLRVTSRRPIGDLKLRVRLPSSRRPRVARIGAAVLRPEGETFDLTGRTGTLRLRVLVRPAGR